MNTRIWIKRGVCILILLVAPAWFAVRIFSHRSEYAGMDEVQRDIWLPSQADVIVLEKEAEGPPEVENKNLFAATTFDLYQQNFAKDGKHTVYLQKGKVTYRCKEGRITVETTQTIEDRPPFSITKEIKYLGEGRVAWEIENTWGSFFGDLLVVLIFGGFCDLAVAFLIFVVHLATGFLSTDDDDDDDD